jgi:hypothetical protein
MTARPRATIPLFAAAALAAVLAGCGEKITIPVPVGLFSVNAYYPIAQYDDAHARQLAVVNGLLYVVGTDGSLVKRSQVYDERERYDGLADPTALCADDDSDLLFVWEAGIGALDVFDVGDLSLLHSVPLPAVQSATHLAACRTGVEAVDASAHTFVYLADPDSGVVHRYAFYEDGTLTPMGILCRDGGLSVRSVHVPAGLMRDVAGRLWVCDADTNRNWAIRFDPTPDLDDVSGEPEEQDPWRGLAFLVDIATCVPPTEADYVLGDARECDESEWTGGPGDEPGAFHLPLALATDGSGRYYVADNANDRIQIFTPEGLVDLVFGDESLMPAPLSIGVADKGAGSDTNYGAFIFVVSATSGQVHKFISHDEYTDNYGPPPEE